MVNLISRLMIIDSNFQWIVVIIELKICSYVLTYVTLENNGVFLKIR